MNYNRPFLLSKICTTSTAGTELVFTFPQSFLVRKIWVVTKTAGSQAASAIKLQNAAGTTDYSAVTVGTTVANTLITSGGEVADASKVFAAGTVLRLQSITNDATAVYTVFVSGASNE